MPLINLKRLLTDIKFIHESIKCSCIISCENHVMIKIYLILLCLYMKVVTAGIYHGVLCLIITSIMYIYMITICYESVIYYVFDMLVYMLNILYIHSGELPDIWICFMICKLMRYNIQLKKAYNTDDTTVGKFPILLIFDLSSGIWFIVEQLYVIYYSTNIWRDVSIMCMIHIFNTRLISHEMSTITINNKLTMCERTVPISNLGSNSHSYKGKRISDNGYIYETPLSCIHENVRPGSDVKNKDIWVLRTRMDGCWWSKYVTIYAYKIKDIHQKSTYNGIPIITEKDVLYLCGWIETLLNEQEGYSSSIENQPTNLYNICRNEIECRRHTIYRLDLSRMIITDACINSETQISISIRMCNESVEDVDNLYNLILFTIVCIFVILQFILLSYQIPFIGVMVKRLIDDNIGIGYMPSSGISNVIMYIYIILIIGWIYKHPSNNDKGYICKLYNRINVISKMMNQIYIILFLCKMYLIYSDSFNLVWEGFVNLCKLAI